MSKKTKKSRVATAALGSLAGIATVASVASVIACGHRSKENAPSNQQVDTSHINLSGVKVFDNGEVQGLPQLPKGVHLDYFLDGQTKVVHNVGDLGQLQAGVRLYLQLGADAGYALNGDLHKTSVLIDHHAGTPIIPESPVVPAQGASTEQPGQQEQVHRTLVQVTPEALKPITVRQGEAPALPTILGGTWVLEGGGTFDSNSYEPGHTVTFTLQPASNDYEVQGHVQLSVTIHGVVRISDFSTKPFLNKIEIFSTGQIGGAIAVPHITHAAPLEHWQYLVRVGEREFVLSKSSQFPAGTKFVPGATGTITLVPDENYEFVGYTPEVLDFKVEIPRVPKTLVQVTPEALKPIAIHIHETPDLPIIVGARWFLPDGKPYDANTFSNNNYEPGHTVTFTLQPISNDYEVQGQVQLSVNVFGWIDGIPGLNIGRITVTKGGVVGLPSVPTNGHWHYSASVGGKTIALDKDGRFPAGTTLTIGTGVTINAVSDEHYSITRFETTQWIGDYVVEDAA